MRPGFRSFEWVRKGQVLAEFNGREVRAAFDALLLMPRYQPQGEDGFFLAAPVRPIWLSISKWLRHMGVERLVPLLPGISPHPTEKNRFVVAAGKNGWVPPRVVDVMHICGYRRRHSEGELLVFSRRGK